MEFVVLVVSNGNGDHKFQNVTPEMKCRCEWVVEMMFQQALWRVGKLLVYVTATTLGSLRAGKRGCDANTEEI